MLNNRILKGLLLIVFIFLVIWIAHNILGTLTGILNRNLDYLEGLESLL